MKNLLECASRWRRSLKDAATGPLVIAVEVIAITDDWESYRKDSGGLTASAFLRRELGGGRDRAFFERRADAVTKLGEAVRRTMHHEVAVWVAQNFSGLEARRVAKALTDSFVRNNKNPLTLAQAKPVAFKVTNRKTERIEKQCSRCLVLTEENRALREQLTAMGVVAS